MVNTVPIGSFYRVCVTNITNGAVVGGIEESEYTNDPAFPYHFHVPEREKQEVLSAIVARKTEVVNG